MHQWGVLGVPLSRQNSGSRRAIKEMGHPKIGSFPRVRSWEKTSREGEKQLKSAQSFPTTAKSKNHPKKPPAKTCGARDTNPQKLISLCNGGRNKTHLEESKKAAAVSGSETIIRSLPSRHPGVSRRVTVPLTPRPRGPQWPRGLGEPRGL